MYICIHIYIYIYIYLYIYIYYCNLSIYITQSLKTAHCSPIPTFYIVMDSQRKYTASKLCT